jgi:cell division protein FtsQ
VKTNKFKKAGRKISIFGILKRFAVLIVIFTIAVIVSIYVSSHPLPLVLPIKHVIFIGNKHLTDDELTAIAGIRENNSLVMISNKEVGQRLLRSPWIRSVSVRKELPETLSLVIEEAAPFALLDMNGHLFLIDEKGKLLEELKDDSIPFLPIITGDPFKDSEGFSEAINLVKLMNDKGFSSERDHIEIIAQKPHELTSIIDGTVVKMGSGEYEEKLKRMIELEEEIKNRGIHVDYIDLRFANKAIIKPVIKEVIK